MVSSLVAWMIKNLPVMWETRVWSLGGEDPLEKEIATHSSILAWRTPWTEEPGGLQSMGSRRVRHNWATNTQLLYGVFRSHKNILILTLVMVGVIILKTIVWYIYFCHTMQLVGSWFPEQGLNLHSQQWKHWTTSEFPVFYFKWARIILISH